MKLMEILRDLIDWPLIVRVFMDSIQISVRFSTCFAQVEISSGRIELEKQVRRKYTPCSHASYYRSMEPHCSKADPLSNVIRKPLFHSPLLCKMSITVLTSFPARFAPFAMLLDGRIFSKIEKLQSNYSIEKRKERERKFKEK